MSAPPPNITMNRNRSRPFYTGFCTPPAVYLLDSEELGEGKRQVRRGDIGIEPLHPLQFRYRAVTPDLGDKTAAQIIDGTFNPCGKLRRIVALPTEVAKPLRSVASHEVWHGKVLSHLRGGTSMGPS